jgi:hypothetical protein
MVALPIPSRGHFIEQFIFPVVMYTTLVAARTEVYLAVVWQWTLLSRKHLDNSLPRNGHLSMQWSHLSQYVYDFITKLCRQQAERVQNHENEHVRNTGQGETIHRKYKRLKLGGGQAYDRSSD